MITLAHIGRIVWINQIIERKANKATNNLQTKLISDCRVRINGRKPESLYLQGFRALLMIATMLL